MWICVFHLIISNLMISNDLMENFEWKTEDWEKNRSVFLSKSKQDLTEIGILHNFANFRQRKGSQRETRRDNSDRFLGPNLPQKGPLCDLCHTRKKNWPFLMAFPCIKFLERKFDIKFTSVDYFLMGFEIGAKSLIHYLVSRYLDLTKIRFWI